MKVVVVIRFPTGTRAGIIHLCFYRHNMFIEYYTFYTFILNCTNLL